MVRCFSLQAPPTEQKVTFPKIYTDPNKYKKGKKCEIKLLNSVIPDNLSKISIYATYHLFKLIPKFCASYAIQEKIYRMVDVYQTCAAVVP